LNHHALQYVNTFVTRWFPCGDDIHSYLVVLVVNPRRWLLLGIFHLQAKVVDKANVLLPSLRSIANIFPKNFRLYTTATSLGLLEPLFWRKFHFIRCAFWDRQPTLELSNNFISIPK